MGNDGGLIFTTVKYLFEQIMARTVVRAFLYLVKAGIEPARAKPIGF